ncbi:hypothetical protein ACH5Y9_05560 [Methylomonas sp. BW4-1]|uniref:hypothetical protein n=1 Tax=unclassified Methylomonas TaxID=2608980 RepID=UPI001967D7D5|nr:hypothetical protein [Methylomonas sp. EFPC1]QSB03430.1 hypothetical protein JWZ98_11135 [Methylomonas sp. EFPC1]
MSNVHIEIKQATVRRFEDGKSFENADPFNLITTLDFIGRGEVQMGGDLAFPEAPITRADLRELKRQLIGGYSVRRLYCWRAKGHKPPFPGRPIREDGNLVYWEMVF